MRKHFAISLFLVLIVAIQVHGQLPTLTTRNGRHTLLVDGKPYFILGGQAHNSSGWPAMLPNVWAAAKAMHLNTLEVPIYWEQVEPEEGRFDFSIVDSLLLQGREHRLRLVLLWFATWKNGSNHYIPGWMKKQSAKYPNIIGKDGKPVDSPSPNFNATLEADKKAFVAVMQHLKKADPEHTVIMVQVENEAGAWNSVRDYSAAAQKQFEANVPRELLTTAVLKQLNVKAGATGNWQQVFGERADEYFHAWSVARFIGAVAAAGKNEYALPLYTNAALRDPLTNPMADHYESGGPTDNVIAIWKVAAPALDLVAPDIYLTGSERILKVTELYDRADNALFVPEAALNHDKVRFLYDVIARGGIGYTPFGIDNNGDTTKNTKLAEVQAGFGREFSSLEPMMNEIAGWGSEGKIKAVVEHDDFAPQQIDLDNWTMTVLFGGNGRGNAAPINTVPKGKLLIVQLGADQFLLVGTDCHIKVESKAGGASQYDKVEEGHYVGGQFKLTRIQNGDETDWGGPGFGLVPTVLRVSLLRR